MALESNRGLSCERPVGLGMGGNGKGREGSVIRVWATWAVLLVFQVYARIIVAEAIPNRVRG